MSTDDTLQPVYGLRRSPQCAIRPARTRFSEAQSTRGKTRGLVGTLSSLLTGKDAVKDGPQQQHHGGLNCQIATSMAAELYNASLVEIFAIYILVKVIDLPIDMVRSTAHRDLQQRRSVHHPGRHL